jgi:hypothetical protein
MAMYDRGIVETRKRVANNKIGAAEQSQKKEEAEPSIEYTHA